MTSRSTTVLVAAAVVVLGVGLYFGAGVGQQQAQAPAPQPAFPGLADKLQEASAIDLAQGGKMLQLTRKGDAWVLPAKGGYPAQDATVHQLLANLAELKLDEPRTANPDDYAKLGVEDQPKEPPKSGDSGGATLVRVRDSKGAEIAGLIVGHSHVASGGSGQQVYVRRPGDAQAWLADGSLSAQMDPADWLDATVTDIAADKIAGVTITRGDQTLQFAREGQSLALKSPADHPKLDDAKLDDVAGALAGLTLDDVKPAPAPGTPEGKAVFTTTDGMTVTADVSKDGGKVWVELSAAGADKAKAAADALQARVKGWAYQVGAWKEQALVPTLAQLAPPGPTPATSAAAPK